MFNGGKGYKQDAWNGVEEGASSQVCYPTNFIGSTYFGAETTAAEKIEATRDPTTTPATKERTSNLH